MWRDDLSVKIEKRRYELLGKDFQTNRCGKCFVIDYKGANNVTVMFYEPMFIVNCTFNSLSGGHVTNPYQITVHGVGYLGVGKYSPKERKVYTTWRTMLSRAYDTLYQKVRPSYDGVTVCKEWHNFQNFAEWYYRQKDCDSKDIRGKSYQLDKDILIKGNKVYSPQTCCFIPHEVNSLLISCQASRGDCPVGVDLFKRTGKYVSKVRVGGVARKQLGYFDTSQEAFLAYKAAKEAYIKEVAEKWKGKIDEKVYKALLEWKIEITD